jgi:glucokinase
VGEGATAKLDDGGRPGPSYVGVDLGGTNLKVALVAADGTIVAREVEPTRGREGSTAVLAQIAAAVGRLAATATATGPAAAVGVGVPALIDMEAGVVLDLPNLPGRWPGVPVAGAVAAATGLPTFLINDVRALTVAEHALGAARGAETAVCVAVGTGIGGGLVAHGRVVLGLGGAAGEVGHLIVDPNGPRCGCGNHGCAEAFASGPAIAAEALRRLLQGSETAIGEMAGGNLAAVTPELVARAAAVGDPVAIEVLERAGSYLGLALVGVIATLAPEIVVLGGGVAQPEGFYWRAAEATARANSHSTEIDRIAFVPPAFGYDAGVLGAAWWAKLKHEGGSAGEAARPD